MNYGRYFRVYHEFSLRRQEIQVYLYRVLEDRQKASARFRIYVALSRESIDFNVHYFSEDGREHLHTTFLSLMLSEKAHQLTDTLSEVFETPYPPRSGRGNWNYLHQTVDRIKKGYESVSDVQTGKNASSDLLSYSEIDKFGVFDANGEMVTKPGKETKVSFIRKVVLDFLFDLVHTRVFQTSPHYGYIYNFIQGHYFLSSLLRKADFYYCRHLLACQHQPELEKLYGEQLLKAEAAWTDAIRTPLSDDVFSASGGWFDSPEEEMNSIYMYDGRREESIIYSEKLNDVSEMKASYQLSSKWYMKRYALPNLFRILFPGAFRLAGKLLFAVASLFFITRLIPLPFLSIFLFVFLIFLVVVIILDYINIAALRSIWRFWGIHIFIPRLFIAIVAGWVTTFWGSGMLSFGASLDKNTNFSRFLANKYSYWLLIMGLMLSMLIFIFYQTGKYNPYGQGRTRAGMQTWQKNYRQYQWSKFWKSCFLLFIGWIYSLSIGLFLFSIFNAEETILINLFFLDFPNEMLLYTFFAQFIGVFIQLTFEEKPMTEEL